MGKKLDLNYFYGQESDQFNFIRIPKPLLYDPMYKEITLEEAVTYSMLLDRMSLSIKNNWFDELGRAYVYCSIETIMEFSNRGRNKAGDILKHLDEIGLIEKVLIPGRGLKIYVKNFIPKDAPKFENQTLGKAEEVLSGMEESNEDYDDYEEAAPNSNGGVYILNDLAQEVNSTVCEVTDTHPQNKSGVVYFSNTNKNNINNNIFNNTKSNQTISIIDDRTKKGLEGDEMGYAAVIRENIELDSLKERFPSDADFIQGLYDLILETVLTKSDTIVVASNEYSANFVRGKLLKLNYYHIKYVLNSWKSKVDKPRNIRKYLLAALFNAPSTLGANKQVEINHDRALLEDMDDLEWACDN